MAHSLFEKNISELKSFFSKSFTAEDRYNSIIEYGKKIPSMPASLKIKENLVSGCQSILYLHATCVENKMFFLTDAEALISKGLAAILIKAYEGLAPEQVLTLEPTFLLDLQISNSLSLHRSNGLAHIHLKMKQKSLQFLMT